MHIRHCSIQSKKPLLFQANLRRHACMAINYASGFAVIIIWKKLSMYTSF